LTLEETNDRMKTIKTTLIYAIYMLLAVVLNSCYVKYKVSLTSIKSNIPITDITLMKIDSVLSYNKWGIPEKVKIGEAFELIHLTDGRTHKKINFFKENSGYEWFNRDTTSIITPNFKLPGWYYVTGIKTFDRPFRTIVYQVTPKGKVKQYYTGIH
jgi:hypothetical protein